MNSTKQKTKADSRRCSERVLMGEVRVECLTGENAKTKDLDKFHRSAFHLVNFLILYIFLVAFSLINQKVS